MIGIVLAGGNSRRFGSDKLLVKVRDKPLISYTLENLSKSKYIDKIVIVTSRDKKDEYSMFGYPLLIDNLLVGPIGGIYLAIKHFGDCFVLAGDMPLVKPRLIDLIIGKFYSNNCHVSVPMWSNGYLEPLCASYSGTLMREFWEQIKNRQYAIWKLILKVRACFIEIDSLPAELRRSFMNINTKEDLELFLSIMRKGR